MTSNDSIRLVGFDGDDTLWRSEDYYHAAQADFERILQSYVDLHDARTHERLYSVEMRNLALFGYGVKSMTLSMVEAAVEITDARISATDLHRIVSLGKELLRHPVELLPGIREAVEAIARDHEIVLITKGDLFHQENKVRQSGLADLFRRIEIVSEKDAATYSRVLSEELSTTYGADLEAFIEKRFGDKLSVRLSASNLLDASKDEFIHKFDNMADQIDRDYDEYELETEQAGPSYQLVLRYAF